MTASSSITSHAISGSLMLAGVVACAGFGVPLAKDEALKTPLNPFGINTSPYGEVLAMAMQEPIDSYWQHGANDTTTAKAETPPAAGKSSTLDRFRIFLDHLSEAATKRTNPKPESQAQKRFVRRQIEDKLRFAYELDPSHYANYNSYHFFLTEPELGTRPQLTPGAALLARQTISYCLAKTDDPRAALTAAAAAENLLELLFNDQRNEKPRYTTAQMRAVLATLDQSIARYDELAAQWEKNGTWSNFSSQRRIESDDRHSFVLKIRETAEATITRIEQKPNP